MTTQAQILRRHFGAADVSLQVVLDAARTSLGDSRTQSALSAIRAGRLSARARQASELAALTVGTRQVGIAWWSRPLPDPWDEGPQPTPDDVLQRGVAMPDRSTRFTDLERLGFAIADACTLEPVDFVDLNMPLVDDIVPVPPGAAAGDRFVVSYDPGARLYVDVVQREDETVGKRLDLSSCWCSDPVEVSWAVGLAFGHCAPLRMPGEDDHGPLDQPVNAPAELLDELEAWTDASGRRAPLRTRGQLLEWVAARNDGTGRTVTFEKVLLSLVDDAQDHDRLAADLALLRRLGPERRWH